MPYTNALTSLAILKVNYDEQGTDFVQNFVPFVAEALRRQVHDIVSLAELQSGVEVAFGIRIPQGALRTMLKRAQSKGYVTNNAGVFYRNLAAIPDDFAQQSHQTITMQQSVTAKFIAYAKTDHNQSLDESAAEKLLLTYIQEKSIPILQTAMDGKPLNIETKAVPYQEYLVASFLLHLDQTDLVGFSHIEAITKGQMLASLLFVSDLNKVLQKFADLTAYLDTQLILRALGFEGDGFREPCLELIAALHRMGVNIACFKQTLDEIRGILDALVNSLKSSSHVKKKTFPVMEYAVSQKWRASDIELKIATLEVDLRRLHIYVRDKPDHTTALGLNETEFAEVIGKHVVGQKVEAQRHDLDCCTSIHRLRKGQAKYDIETCQYIFVTSNLALARAASEFFINQYERFTVPLCVNDHTLATLAWVKDPLFSADLSKKMLIADSYAAIRPSRDLWRKYIDEINKQLEHGSISDDQFQLLRFTLVAKNALLDMTHGRADAFTEGTVPEVLERVQKNMTRDVLDQLAAQTALLKKTSETSNTQRTRVLDRIAAISKHTGRLTFLALIAILVLTTSVGLFATLPASLIGFDINLMSTGGNWLRFAIVIFCGISLGALLYGISFLSLGEKIEAIVYRKVTQVLRKLFLVTE